MSDFFKKTVNFLKDVLFPKHCLECGQEGEWICQKCLKILRLVVKPQFFCPRCYKDNFSGRTCPDCQPQSPLDRAVAAVQYEERLVSQLVKLLKYNYVEEVGAIFGRLIEDFGRQNPTFLSAPAEEYLIVPVPLHRRRYVWRGFNQAEILARYWSDALKIELDSRLLARQRHTRTQVGLTGEQRRKNLVGAFAVKKPLLKAKIILVDDVFTTGSTLQECARVLKSAGAQEVWGLTLARER